MKPAASRQIDSDLHLLPPAVPCQRRTLIGDVLEAGGAQSPEASYPNLTYFFLKSMITLTTVNYFSNDCYCWTFAFVEYIFTDLAVIPAVYINF